MCKRVVNKICVTNATAERGGALLHRHNEVHTKSEE